MNIIVTAALLLLSLNSIASGSSSIPTPIIGKAMEFIQLQKPGEALKLLSSYKSSAEDLAYYHYAHAQAYKLLGRQTDSLAHFRLAYIYSRGEEMKELALIERSESYFKMRYYAEAAISYRQFLNNFPRSPKAERARLGLAESLYHQGMFSEALMNYEQAGNLFQAQYGRANALQALGRLGEAYSLYVSILGKDREYLNSSPETLYRLAETFRLQGKLSDAKIYYTLIKDPLVKAKASIGMGLIDLGEAGYDSACKYFDEASKTSDRRLRSEALLHLSEAHSKAGRHPQAKTALIEIRNTYPYSREYDTVLLMLTRIYRMEGKQKEALGLMREMGSRSDHSKETLDEFERIMIEAKDGNAAELVDLWNYFGRFLLEPQRSTFLTQMAGGLKSSGRPFVDLCRWLISNGSNDAKSQCSLMLADFYAELGDAGKSLAHIKGVKGNRDDILRIRARAYKENGEYQKAMQAIISLKGMKPNDVTFFADMLESSKDIKKAVAFLERSLKTTGAPLKVYIKLADALDKMGRKEDALKFYQIVASLKPEKRKDLTQDEVGWTYYMVSKLSTEKNSSEVPESVQQWNNVYGQSAELAAKEADILKRAKRIF